MTIERLLSAYIDAGVTEDSVALRHWVLQVENADASDVAYIVKEVYKSAMATTGPSGGGQAFVLPFGPQPQQQQGNQKPPALSITVDDRSNSLVMVCSEGMYKDVKTLVENLDSKEVSNTEVVQLVKLKGIDPQLVQQAVNAFQGIAPQQGRGGGFGGGGFPGGGFGGGGFPGGGIGGGGFPGGGFGGGGFPGGGGGFGGGGFGGGGRGPAMGGGGGGNRGGGGGGDRRRWRRSPRRRRTPSLQRRPNRRNGGPLKF